MIHRTDHPGHREAAGIVVGLFWDRRDLHDEFCVEVKDRRPLGFERWVKRFASLGWDRRRPPHSQRHLTNRRRQTTSTSPATLCGTHLVDLWRSRGVAPAPRPGQGRPGAGAPEWTHGPARMGHGRQT